MWNSDILNIFTVSHNCNCFFDQDVTFIVWCILSNYVQSGQVNTHANLPHYCFYVQEPLKLDIVISFPDHGFHLRFDSWSQVLFSSQVFIYFFTLFYFPPHDFLMVHFIYCDFESCTRGYASLKFLILNVFKCVMPLL